MWSPHTDSELQVQTHSAALERNQPDPHLHARPEPAGQGGGSGSVAPRQTRTIGTGAQKGEYAVNSRRDVEPAVFVILFILLFGGVIVLMVWLHRSNKRLIEAAVSRRGGQVVSINFDMRFSFFWDRSAQHWNVEWKDDKGRRQRAVCRTGLFSGLRWLNGPLADRPIP